MQPQHELHDPVSYGAYKLLADRLTDLEQELADTREIVGRLSQRVSELEGQAPAVAHTSNKPKITPLPLDLVSLYEFVNRHWVPKNEVRQFMKAGFIHSIVGKWTTDKGRIEEALDQAGQHEFWVQLHNRNDFQECDQCPHTESEQ